VAPETFPIFDKILDTIGNDFTPRNWLDFGMALIAIAFAHMPESEQAIARAKLVNICEQCAEHIKDVGAKQAAPALSLH
jgi:hypothetical protein